jgi:ribosomal protein S18 acetylase RimI-like enzyme
MARRHDISNIDIRPLTPDLWPALIDLFGEKGAANGCWCMYARIGAYYKRRAAANKADFEAVVRHGPPPGLLAFAGALPVGWCQVTPRDAVPWLDRVWRLKRVDDQPVWSLSCLYIRIGYRRSGLATRLIGAAIETARAAGAPALEAYPLDGELSPSSTSTGYVSTYRRLGFRQVARRSPERPIMRYALV